jgi:sterol-4alpha-carboxylate 3-dehydrogenase (decarboxylating)
MAPIPQADAKADLGKVLVTGGCGMLGYSVASRLLKAYKANVAVVDLRCPQERRLTSGDVKYYEADITDAVRLTSVFDEFKPTVVIHTAAPVPQSDAKNDKLYEKVNVHGMQAIIEACQETGVKALVYTSSASVVSDNEHDLINATEEFPVIRGKEQTEYYSETKVSRQLALSPLYQKTAKR